MTIPFIKAHGAGNDFLLTWADRAPQNDLPAVARAICDRHTGVGADGWIVVAAGNGDAHAALRGMGGRGVYLQSRG